MLIGKKIQLRNNIGETFYGKVNDVSDGFLELEIEGIFRNRKKYFPLVSIVEIEEG